MKFVTLLKFGAIASVSAAAGFWLAAHIARKEYVDLTNWRKNLPLVADMSRVQFTQNMMVETKPFKKALDGCLKNANSLLAINHLNDAQLSQVGWQNYVRGDIVYYLIGRRPDKSEVVIACLLRDSGETIFTELISPKIPGNPALEIHEASMLDVNW